MTDTPTRYVHARPTATLTLRRQFMGKPSFPPPELSCLRTSASE